MRILLLTQIVPFPPDSGPKVKTLGVLRYLARSHEVHLVSFARSAEEEAHARALAAYCRSVTTVPLHRSRLRDAYYLARSLVSGRPFLVERDDSAAVRGAISRLLAERAFDAVHADQLSMAQFAVDLDLPLRVLDEHNAVWTIVRRSARQERLGPKRALAEIEWRKLRAYERKICDLFDRVTVVSREDRRALGLDGADSDRTHVIPISVDTGALRFEPPEPGARDVVSVATMFYPPNVEGVYWFGSEVFPAIRQKLPETRFHVVGSRPPGRIVGLATPESGIVVTGYLPDLAPVFRQSAVIVVPLHSGSGMRVKILEAFARGKPVVSTTIGVEGIEAEAGRHLLVADDPADFAEAVIRLIEDTTLARRVSGAARALVEARYDWRTALRGLDGLYRPSVWPGAATPTFGDKREWKTSSTGPVPGR